MILLLPSCLSAAFFIPQTTLRTTLHCAAATTNEQQHAVEQFTLERVSNRHRALDVRVFRGFSISAKEYQQEYFQKNGETISEQEAVIRLTSGVDDNGRDTTILGGPVVTFVVAVSSDSIQEFAARTHGVVATVDVKLLDNYMELKNLHVEERVRRRGLASLLVQAVKEFTRTASPVNEVVLNVKLQNANAIALYEKEGFEFQEEREGDGRMVCRVSHN